mgnify:CR=1 FL=1
MPSLRRALVFVAVLSSFILHPSSFLLAQPPLLIHYQGRLVDGATLVNGTVSLQLDLYNASSGGSLLYSDLTATQAVVDGLYNTTIGDGTVTGSLVTALNQAEVWLQVTVDGVPLAPRERMAAVGYALSVRGLSVSTNQNVILNSGDGFNVVAPSSQRSVIGGGDMNVIGLVNTGAVIAGGSGNLIGDMVIADVNSHAAIGGGVNNVIDGFSYQSVIGGGIDHHIFGAERSVIGGGGFHFIDQFSFESAISGGRSNLVEGNSQWSVIAGGMRNTVGFNSHGGVIGGGQGNYLGTNADYSVIGGGRFNQIGNVSPQSVIAGGSTNRIAVSNAHAVISGGSANQIGINADHAVIGGGFDNEIGRESTYAGIGGGTRNTIGDQAFHARIGGGTENVVRTGAWYAVVSGGLRNRIETNALYASVGGGNSNVVDELAWGATIPGGSLNLAGDRHAFAAGHRAKALHRGAFVWGDDHGTADVSSSQTNQVTFRASGGFRIFTTSGLNTGVQVAANSGAWTSISDVNMKEDFAPVDVQDVLARVAALPITTWRYKGQDAEIRHIGPTAQDFHAAFAVGDAPGTGITTIDADGVALAAIQALARENDEFRMQNDELKKENEALRERLEAIERKLGM